jgi:hypothetical protein
MEKSKAQSELEKQVINEIKSGLRDAVIKHLGDYGSPLKAMVADAIRVHDVQLRNFIYEAVGEVFLDNDFREKAKEQIRHKVARELTASFGEGIFKKSIDAMKSDPTIKARCVIAIENIVAEASK